LNWHEYQGRRSERARLNKRGGALSIHIAVARDTRLVPPIHGAAFSLIYSIKGVDVAWRTGWLSDRAAAFLALGRPVVTELRAQKNICRQRADSVSSEALMHGNGSERSAAGLAAAFHAGARLRHEVSIPQKTAQNSRPLAAAQASQLRNPPRSPWRASQKAPSIFADCKTDSGVTRCPVRLT